MSFYHYFNPEPKQIDSPEELRLCTICHKPLVTNQHV